MAGFSTYLANSIITTHLRGGATPYVTISTTEVVDAGTGGGTMTTPVLAAFDAPSGGATANTGIVTFTSVAAGTYVYCQVWDTLAKTNLLYSGPLSSSKTADLGDNLSFAAGELDVTNA